VLEIIEVIAGEHDIALFRRFEIMRHLARRPWHSVRPDDQQFRRQLAPLELQLHRADSIRRLDESVRSGLSTLPHLGKRRSFPFEP
jgi:hypothetical protein